MKKPSVGIAWKLIGSLVGSLVLLFGILTWTIYSHHRSHLEKAVVSSAMRIADTVERTMTHDMLRSNCLEAFELIDAIAENDGIDKIRIFNSSGRIEHSTIKSEQRTYVDKDAEQCNVCHSGPEPAYQLDNAQRWRIFRDASGKRVLGLINPIWNEPSCSTAECHYHPADIAVLGVLDVNMSLASVDEIVAGDRNLTISFFFIAVLVIALVSGMFVFFMVHRPVKEMISGMQTISSGNLEHKLKIRRDDELGQLAKSFNEMTIDLKKAQDEIRDWAHTLEQRVEEKTRELERAHNQIMRVEKMASLGKLSAIVAHEINNPLTGVLTYARLLQKKIDKKRVEIEKGAPADFSDCFNHLQVIEHETARCGEIVRNLLMFSKKSTVNFEENDFNELLRKSIKLVNHQLELSEIHLETQLEETLPQIICDAGQIQQIFVALLVNAVEAMDKGGRITVRTFHDFVNQQVVFECDDNGPGMDEDVRRKLFEPFFTTKTGSNGSGLGLAVVYGIVERHGGKITVDSAPGKGANFTIRLPLKPPPGSEQMDDLPRTAPPDRI